MPNLNSAQARDLKVVRATFSGALADLTAGTNGALNVANWSAVGQPTLVIPTAAVTVVAVAQVSTSVLDITVSEEFSFGAGYLLIAKSAASGGITGVPATPNDRAAFTALVPEQPAGRDFNIPDMLPRINFFEDDTQDLEKFTNVLQDMRTLLLTLTDRWTEILDLSKSAENFLDLMLRELGYPFDFALTELDKRRLLAVLVPAYKQKGTAAGIRNTIRFFLGYESDILWLDKTGLGGWVLDDSLLDDNTILGPGTSYDPSIHGADMVSLFVNSRPFDFFLKIGKGGTALTADEDTRARQVIAVNRLHQQLIGIESVLTSPDTASVVAGSGQLTISWSAVAGATDYVVFWGSSKRVSTVAANGVVDAASPLVQVVPSGEKRYYVVAARNGSGVVGVGSKIVSGTAL